MDEPQNPDDPILEDVAEDEREDRRAAIAITAVLLIALVVALAWWLLGDDEDEPSTDTTTTSQETTSTVDPGTSDETTSSAPTSETTEAPFAPTLSEDELAVAVWPDQDSSRRFQDPGAVTHAFATDLLGFSEPLVLGEFMQGDQRSGEVEVRPSEDGPVTTVLVRQMGDDSWWIIGAQTPDIQVDEPEPGATVRSPVQLSGTATAFEGTVEVLVYRDGSDEPIGDGFVTGGATGQLEPFEGEVAFDAEGAQWGAVVFRTTSARDGRVQQATVVRVQLGSAG